MNEEIKSILKMIETGKVTAEEGERLIASLSSQGKEETPYVVTSNRKFIKIEVYDKDEDNDKEETKVKINIPLNLAKAALSMNSIKNQVSLHASDIKIDFDEIIRLIENNANGELVNIESGNTRVRIWIE